jgi:hypothetical protein
VKVKHVAISFREAAVEKNQIGRAGAILDRWEQGVPSAAHAGCQQPWCEVGGFRGELKVGDNIEIPHRQDRAYLRVVWITVREGSSEKEIGAECLEPMRQVWGAALNSLSKQTLMRLLQAAIFNPSCVCEICPNSVSM